MILYFSWAKGFDIVEDAAAEDEVEIINFLGQNVPFEQSGSAIYMEQSGIYFVRVKRNNRIFNQKIIIEKFKGYKPVEDSEIFKKFMKYGADGKFGPSTAGLIQGIKAGFLLSDKSSDITQELIDKIQTEKLL